MNAALTGPSVDFQDQRGWVCREGVGALGMAYVAARVSSSVVEHHLDMLCDRRIPQPLAALGPLFP